MSSGKTNISRASLNPAQALRVFACLLLAFVAACATRPQETEAIRTLVPQEAIDTNILPRMPVEVTTASDDGVHSVLALSAGGADGAYGAGVLAGWSASGTRPEFDVVTGVSTGALLAVLAFLGPEYDDLIRRLYTTQTNASIFRKRGLGGIFSDSLYDNGPFKEQIETHVTFELLDKVTREHGKGRRLYVATTNIDAGELVIWDMGKIASGGGGGRADTLLHFQKVLRASAAVPGYFQPVYIKPKRGVQLRQAHVDGGVKEPVLYENFMGQSRAAKKELFLVINATTRRFNATNPVEPTLASISRKTISELLRELQRDTIFRHYVSARNAGMDFRMTSIPDNIPIVDDVLNFNPERMERLYQAGYAIGRLGVENWKKAPASVRNDEASVKKVASQ